LAKFCPNAEPRHDNNLIQQSKIEMLNGDGERAPVVGRWGGGRGGGVGIFEIFINNLNGIGYFNHGTKVGTG
jgi:hypothetical protein